MDLSSVLATLSSLGEESGKARREKTEFKSPALRRGGRGASVRPRRWLLRKETVRRLKVSFGGSERGGRKESKGKKNARAFVSD